MTNSPNIEALKSKMKSTWEAGDYGTFAKYMEPGAIEIFTSWNIKPGEKMLDVGCGAGQTAIPAAKNGVKVTGVDIASNLIEQAQARAQAEGLDSTFEEGDAEQLNFPDASFDVVISLIGAMSGRTQDPVDKIFASICSCDRLRTAPTSSIKYSRTTSRVFRSIEDSLSEVRNSRSCKMSE